jgi:release factor glutamine methyltransferase
MKLQAALRQASELLHRAAVADARLTAEVLLMHVVGRDRAFLYAHPEYTLSADEDSRLAAALDDRMDGAPTQHITGVQEFYGRPFAVTPDVLIPRPETEHSVERALGVAARGCRVMDIGTGSGALAVTLALELETRAVATDISARALAVARQNAEALGARVDFVACDLASAIGGRFDLIVSNPPYIPEAEIPALQREVRDHEPRVALLGGALGTELYHRIVPEAERLLAPGGWLVFEIGYRGEAHVREAFGPAWRDVATGNDLAGLPRVISAQYAP